MQSLKINIRWYLLAILLFANFFIWNAIFIETRNGILTVVFLDAGQGDAIFIEAPNGNQVLIDGGPNKSVLRQLSKVMPFYDRSIDIVIATHSDKDHIGGLPDVLQRYTVDFILESGAKNDTGISRAFESAILQNKIKRIFAKRGMAIMLGDDVFLNILFPDRDVSEVESNTTSIVAQLVYKNTEFMFTGDSPKTIEEYLVFLDGEKLRSDVLKVGHHGSKTSSLESFVGYVSPEYAIISAGADNSYGHPHKEVVEILNQFGSAILNTKDNGAIIFKSDGENIVVK